MAKSKDIIKIKGTVIKCLPGAKFIVQADEVDVTATCVLSGKLRQNKIMLVENDKVDFEISIYDLTTGRIVWRY